jgi:hypothetical protein
MSDAVVRFRSPRQPAHYVRAGRGYKFVGGRLAVARSDAVAVRAYARANPSLGIVEDRSPRASRAPKVPEGEA